MTKQTPDSMSRLAVDDKNRKFLDDIGEDLAKKGLVPKMSYNDKISYLIREYKKVPHLNKRIEDLYRNRMEYCTKVMEYVDKIGLQCSFCGQKKGVQFLLKISDIPELNQFVPDEDMDLIKKLKSGRGKPNDTIR